MRFLSISLFSRLLTNILCSIFYRNLTIRTAGACTALFGLRVRIPPYRDLPSQSRAEFCFSKIKASPECLSGTYHPPLSSSIPGDVPGRRRFRMVTGEFLLDLADIYFTYLFVDRGPSGRVKPKSKGCRSKREGAVAGQHRGRWRAVPLLPLLNSD
jgi:hypothetical protein